MKYDVLVAGGGPAGLSAALKAAQSGARVAVFERSREIGYPIRTSGGSWIDELRALDIPDKYFHPIREGYFVSPNEQAIFRYEQPASCVLDVRGLYQHLAYLASKAGAEIFVASQVTGPWLDNGALVGLYVKHFGKINSYVGNIVIDATGAGSFLARRLGVFSGFSRFGVGAEYDLHAPDWPQHRATILFGSKFAPSGYAWAFPHGNERVCVGVGLIQPDSPANPKAHLDALLKLPEFSNELGSISRLEYHTGKIPSERYAERTFSDNFLLVGDAGGLISILLGEGIRFSIDIGRMAGRVAGEAVKAERFDAKFLQRFEISWQRKFAHIFNLGVALNQRLCKYTDADWDRGVKLLGKIPPDMLVSLLKGEMSFAPVFNLAKSSLKQLGKKGFHLLKS